MERYHLLLKNRAFLGIIVSNTWLQSITYRKMRAYLTSSYRWLRILHLPNKVFSATVDTHVLIFSKWKNGISPGDTLFIDMQNPEGHVLFNKLRGKYIPKDGSPINILTPPDAQILFKKIQSCSIPLKTICDVFNGVKPFEKGKGNPPQTEDIILKKPYVLSGTRPDTSWTPLLRGRLIRRYINLWDHDYWIKYGPWLAAPRDVRIFEAQNKIYVRQTGDSIIATKIKGNIIARNNLHIVLPKSDEFEIESILGIMNSTLMDFAYTFMNPEKGEALAEVKKEHVELLPIKKYYRIEEKDETLRSDISSRVKIMLKLNEMFFLAKGSEKAQIHHQIEKTDREIDELVYKLYGITDAERAVIEKETDRNKS